MRGGRQRPPLARRPPVAMGFVLGAALVLSACGLLPVGSSQADTVVVDGTPVPAPAEAPTTGAPAPSVVVSAVDSRFEPPVVTVAAGSEVVWTNNGAIEHNIKPVDGSDDFGIGLAEFSPGVTYAHTFDQPGTYRYYCTIHGTQDRGMIGTIEVTT